MHLTFFNSLILDLSTSLLSVILNCLNPVINVKVKTRKLRYDRRSVGQPVFLSNPIWGPKIKFLLLSHSCEFVDVGPHLWREDGSIVYNCCWSSPAQSFSDASSAGLMTISHRLRFETPPTWRARSPYLYPPGTGFPFRRLLQLAEIRCLTHEVHLECLIIQFVPHRKHCTSITTINRSMSSGEMAPFLCENHLKKTNILCGQNKEFFNAEIRGTYSYRCVLKRYKDVIQPLTVLFVFLHEKISA
jgi:hypothetical protein